MTPTGTLVVVIKRLPDSVTFLTSPGDAHAPAPAAAAAAAAAASSPAAASSSSAAAAAAAAVDPSLQPLTDALVELKIGAHKTCAALAEALEQEGIMGIDDLSLLSETKVRDLLARVGLKEVQQLKLMQAVVPLSASASLPKAPASSTSSRHPQCDWAALKKDGFSARELRLAGCDFVSARDVGFDLPSLKAAGYDAAAFRAVGCSWADVKTAGFTAAEARAAGCDLKSAQAAGYEMPSLLEAFGYDAVAAGTDLSSCMLVSVTLCARKLRLRLG
jgi:ribosomal protein L13E